MNILEILKKKISFEDLIIGIGLGENNTQNIEIFISAKSFSIKNNVWIYLFGENLVIDNLKSSRILKDNDQAKVKLIKTLEPEKDMITYALKNNINAMVRGSFKSSKYLKTLKDLLKIKKIYRLALLETANGTQFFFGPVGIDECKNFHDKKIFIEKSLKIFQQFDIKPKISILSGGRISDLGRDKVVNESIEVSENLVNFFIDQNSNLEIYHDEILIENSIRKGRNFILAPNGITGNLIYRTLVHLGNGKSYGAFYLDTEYTIIDTSRIAPQNELNGAFYMAASMASIIKQKY